MAKRLQLRRGTQAQHVAFTGALGEVTVDTTRKALILHDGTTTGGILVTSTGTPLGSPLWHNGARASIETGYVAMDGQLLLRATYPILWAKIQSSFNLVNDTLWLSNNGVRSSYSSGDGSTNFRMPDLNGKSAGALKSPVLRGDGYAASGTVLGDAIRNITGTATVYTAFNAFNTATGAFTVEDGGLTGESSVYNGTTPRFVFNASNVVPTADENRPVSAFGVWICRVGDTTAQAGDPSTNAVLTGGNTFNGSQQINGNVNATDITASGKLKGTLDPATLNSTGTAPFYGCRAWANFNAIPLTGTYSQSGNTVTVTMTAHGMAVGQQVNVSPTSGTSTSGSFTITSVANANTFTYNNPSSLTTSGNITRNLFIRASGNIASITDNGVGDFTVNFAIALPDSNYALQGTGAILNGSGGGSGSQVIEKLVTNQSTSTRSASSCGILVVTPDGVSAVDSSSTNILFFR